MVLDGKSSQEYPVNAGISQESTLGPTLLESDLRETMDWGSKWLVDLNVGKT